MQSPDCQFLWKKKATLTFFGTKPSPISKAFQPKRSKLEAPLFLISDYTDNNKLQQLNGIVAQEWAHTESQLFCNKDKECKIEKGFYSSLNDGGKTGYPHAKR